MSGWRQWMGVGMGVLGLLAASAQPLVAAPATRATVLSFRDTEPGVAPYLTRVLVTRAFLRSDDGHDDGDFLLLDRRHRIVYSVSHGDRTVLVIPYRPVTVAPPARLDLATHHTTDPGAPRIDGRVVLHYTFSAAGKVCREAMVVPGLLPDVAAAQRELEGVLAGQHAADLPKTPADQRSPCMLARQVFAAAAYLRHGLPVQVWDSRGVSRALLDYRTDVPVDPALFRLPAGYRRYSVD